MRNLLLNLAIVVALALFRYSRDICHFRTRFNILVLLSWQPPNVKILIFLSSSIKEGISDATKVMQKDKMHKRFEEKNILKKERRCWITFYNVVRCFQCYFQVTLSHSSQVKDKFCDVLWMVRSWRWHLYCLLAAVTVLQRQFWHAFIANDHHKKYIFPLIWQTNVVLQYTHSYGIFSEY